MIRRNFKLLLALLPLIIFDLPAGCMRGQDAVFSAADHAGWDHTNILVVEDYVPVAVGCRSEDKAGIIGEATNHQGRRVHFLMCCGTSRHGYCEVTLVIPLS